MHVNFSSTLG